MSSAADSVNWVALWHKGLLRWRRARRSFDARALNERRLLIIAVVAGLWFMLDSLWITPGYKQLAASLSRKNQAQMAMQALQDKQRLQQEEMARSEIAVRQELQQTTERMRHQEEEFEKARQVLVPAREMRALLEGLLAEQRSLRLMSMKTLPREDIPLPHVDGAGQTSQLFRHGLEIKVVGSFHDILNWLRSLESLPRKVLWDDMKLQADDQAVLMLTLNVHTLSKDREPMEMAP
ncbi:MAG TPA: type 4a pilus biogenesis protein PilO [Candidatus Aquabacterium excrementipullorum]|nr:type 4a pilus biogenesis protein PilO [Candidatus Aquabacterium excrementipullorum]